ncbi:MAG: hypothetical protein ACOYKJ_07835 [Candidatus Howiella sp.]|jgi:hypothetical protein
MVPQFHKFSDKWDHEHGEFCRAKFMEEDDEGVLHAVYCTLNKQNRIRPECYGDFRERLG